MVSKQPILITRLRPNETLHVKGHAVKKTSRFHAGFSPVSLCTFSFLRDEHEAAKKDNILDKERAYMRNAYGDPIAFKVDIEPKVALSPRYLVSKALGMLINKLTTLQHELYADESEKLVVEAGDTGGYNFTISNEDDTLGNMIQSYMHVHHVREGKQAPSGSVVTYVGYYWPHSLGLTVVVNVRLSSDAKKKEYIDVMAATTRAMIAQLQDIMNMWLQFAPKN